MTRCSMQVVKTGYAESSKNLRNCMQIVLDLACVQPINHFSSFNVNEIT